MRAAGPKGIATLVAIPDTVPAQGILDAVRFFLGLELSITYPWRDRMLNTVSFELTAGWQFRPRVIRSRGVE